MKMSGKMGYVRNVQGGKDRSIPGVDHPYGKHDEPEPGGDPVDRPFLRTGNGSEL